MAKKYVTADAELNCQYGGKSCLVVPEDRHIGISGKMMANETDFKNSCMKGGGFGSCTSPHAAGYENLAQTMHDMLSDNNMVSLHQLFGIVALPCQYVPGTQWLETKEDVYIAGYRALMEDSWTFCQTGLGFITLLNSGQSENAAEALEEHLKELEAVVDQYIKDNGLPQSIKSDLLNSVLLWNGYPYVPWDTKVSQELWDFGIYMEKNYPSLCNYFERGIYLFDEQTGANIDISYMAGLSIAMKDPSNSSWGLLPGTLYNDKFINQDAMYNDEAIYNGYLEASRQGASENAWEAMEKFLDSFRSPEYNGNGRYTDFLQMSEEDRAVYEDMYNQGCSMDGSYYEPGVPLDQYGDPEEIMERQERLSNWPEWSQEEKDLLILERGLSSCIGEDGAKDFTRKVCESAGREQVSWKDWNRGD